MFRERWRFHLSSQSTQSLSFPGCITSTTCRQHKSLPSHCKTVCLSSSTEASGLSQDWRGSVFLDLFLLADSVKPAPLTLWSTDAVPSGYLHSECPLTFTADMADPGLKLPLWPLILSEAGFQKCMIWREARQTMPMPFLHRAFILLQFKK